MRLSEIITKNKDVLMILIDIAVHHADVYILLSAIIGIILKVLVDRINK